MKYQQLDISENQFNDLINEITRYKTDLYEIQKTFAGEIRFGPAYYGVKVLSKGVEIWNGGDNIYGEESFQNNFLGEKYYKLILIRWYSQLSPYDQAVVEVNLATGEETKLVENQRYWEAGHFNSFDGVFYRKSEIKDYLCKDLGTKSDFLLYERIKDKVKQPFSWHVTTINDCILVFSKERTDNVILYNIRKKEVIDYMTVDFNISENGKLSTYLDKRNSSLIINSFDYDIAEDRRIINERNHYHKIEIK